MVQSSDIQKQFQSLSSEIISWRRHIHENPELGYEEEETAIFIEEKLHSWGFKTERIAKTGIVSVIPSSNPRCIGIRADIDALPIEELKNRPYHSKNPGKMHACGHDSHIAILLGLTKFLSQLSEDDRPCTVKLFFQPAEEGPGGADAMVDAGALDTINEKSPEAIISLHVASDEKPGTIEVKHGPMFASADEFYVKITGRGGHGAYPHTAIDPIPVAAELITMTQRLITREINPNQPCVLTYGTINAGTAFNIIPHEVELSGTLRTLDEEVRSKIQQRLGEIVDKHAQIHNCQGIIEWKTGYNVGINDPNLTDIIARAADRIVGQNLVWKKESQMGGEDFYYFGKTGIPVSMFYLGAHPKSGPVPHHSPDFDIEEEVLYIGAAVFYETLREYFKS
ncbi:MAG: M20 metallopeptidase family protein [Candidatus Hodarchaeales archaeon]|jgi:amidohydrolase